MVEAAVSKENNAQGRNVDVRLARQTAYVQIYPPSAAQGFPNQSIKSPLGSCANASDFRHDLTAFLHIENVSHLHFAAFLALIGLRPDRLLRAGDSQEP